MTIKTGDKVHWTHTSRGKRTLSMRRRDGVVESINGDMAIVKCNGRQVEVEVKRLRTESQPSQVTEFVDAMVEASRSK